MPPQKQKTGQSFLEKYFVLAEYQWLGRLYIYGAGEIWELFCTFFSILCKSQTALTISLFKKVLCPQVENRPLD